jgi:hypothetical protein
MRKNGMPSSARRRQLLTWHRTAGLVAAALLVAGGGNPLAAGPPTAYDCEKAYIPRSGTAAAAPLVAAAYGNFEFACTVKAFLEAVPRSFKTAWVQRWDQGCDAEPYFRPGRGAAPCPGTDSATDFSRPDGVNSGPILFMDIAHGTRQCFQAQQERCEADDLSLGRGESPLRYFWQCSCNVFQHGRGADGSPDPGTFLGHWDDADSDEMPNAWKRWWGSISNPGLRLACGGSTPVSCSDAHMQSIWFYKSVLGEDVASSFLLGMVEPAYEPVCVARGGQQPADSPLADADFLTALNRPRAANRHVFLEYPTVLPSSSPQGGEHLDLAVLYKVEGSPAPRTPPAPADPAQRYWNDGTYERFVDGALEDAFIRQEDALVALSGDTYIHSARSFLTSSWNESALLYDACAIALHVLAAAEDEAATRDVYLKSIVVLLAPSGQGNACNLTPQGTPGGNFAVIEENAAGQVRRAIAYFGYTQYGPPLSVSPEALIAAAGIDLRRNSVSGVRVVYSPLGGVVIPRVEITVQPRDRGKPIEVRRLSDFGRLIAADP